MSELQKIHAALIQLTAQTRVLQDLADRVIQRLPPPDRDSILEGLSFDHWLNQHIGQLVERMLRNIEDRDPTTAARQQSILDVLRFQPPPTTQDE